MIENDDPVEQIIAFGEYSKLLDQREKYLDELMAILQRKEKELMKLEAVLRAREAMLPPLPPQPEIKPVEPTGSVMP